MILHFVTDEKFTDYAIEQFLEADMESDFVLIDTENWSVNIKMLKYVELMRYDDERFTTLLDKLANYKAIVLHGLF